ncbi:MAG TPA: PilZ domain-containing protein [Candidatus Acidoferrum sp.]|nr:PilZ domain-containing protein [Candidatus Acidoferrum sp.]
MSATNRALPLHLGNEESIGAKLATPMPLQVAAASEAVRVPALRVTPLLSPGQPRRFFRVPTHAVGVNRELREYPRASLKLPLRLRKVDDVAEEFPVTLVTRDISSTGVFFLCPKEIVVGALVELEIVLVSRPLGHGSVVIVSAAQVRRIEPAAMPGWYGVAASFDDVHFDRDDGVPSRFLQP